MSAVKQNLIKAGIKLPALAAPAANYLPYQLTGNLVFLSGQLPKDPATGKLHVGQLGRDATLQQGQEAARLCTVGLISAIQHATKDDFSRMKRVVKITCFVNSTADFTEHHLVANGASDLLVEVFGREVGPHARAAVGMAQLPLGVMVEIEAIVELGPSSNGKL